MGGKFYEKFEKKSSPKVNKKGDSKGAPKNTHSAPPAPRTTKTTAAGGLSQKVRKPHSQGASGHQHKKTQELFTTDKLTPDTKYILANFDDIIQGVRPLNSKQLQQLPDNIKALSHQLTDKRSERRLGYMNDNVQLSSYVRYYTWWNLVRLTRLFSNLPAESFPHQDTVCIDLGTGPLTVVNALWLARPELRKLHLTWYCLDVSSNSMVLGEDLFYSIAAKDGDECKWNIIRVKGSFGTSIKQKAGFITCANMFNELDQAGDMPPEYQTKKYFHQLQTYGKEDCKFLLIEPGVPKATRTITLLRDRFLSAGKEIAAPCPHYQKCPMNGFKAYTGSTNKWCNFAFSTEDAPARLLKLSEQAKLPKERATLIFISVINKADAIKGGAESQLTGTVSQHTGPEGGLPLGKLTCRITSDPFRLPENKIGYYGCSSLGLTLVKTSGRVSKVPEGGFSIEGPLASGDLISVKIKTPESSLPKDQKSGALIIEF